MSNYYLCDTCAACNGCVVSKEKRVVSDNQTPREVCPHWKPKEKE